MEVLTALHPVPTAYRRGVVALGHSRTLHRGHQAVVMRARSRAGRTGRPLIVMTSNGTAPSRGPGLTTLEQRVDLFRRDGADAVWIGEDGDPAIPDCEPVAVFVGEGALPPPCEGDIADPAVIEVVARLADSAGVITLQRIVAALVAGDCAGATAMLGRPFAVRGEVQHGHKLGRTIGFPTANLLMTDYVRPAYGVYAVRGRLPGGRMLDGVANLGIRPIMDQPEELLEPFFFDFTGDLYGQTVEVSFIARLRAEARMSSFDELRSWIERDCSQARSILENTPHVA